MKSKYPGIVIHCSDSSFGNAQIIEDWHKQRGWSDIGYHFTILNGQFENDSFLSSLDGSIEAGRDMDNSGAHAKGYNNYIGICLIGKNNFTINQFDSLCKLIKDLQNIYNIESKDIFGHNEISSKTCPNFDVKMFKNKYNIG